MSKNIFAACLVISIVFHTIIAAFLISHKIDPKNISNISVQQVSLVGNLKFGTDAIHKAETSKSFWNIARSKQNETTSSAENLHPQSKPSETPKHLETKAVNLPARSQPGNTLNPATEEDVGKSALTSEPTDIGIGSEKGEEQYTHSGSHMNGTQGKIIKARIINQLDISYDETSRKRGEEGKVSILLEIDRSGNPRNIRLAESSGYPRLDRVALNGIRASRFSPTLKSGRPVVSQIEYTIIFTLDDMRSNLKVVEDDKVNILE